MTAEVDQYEATGHERWRNRERTRKRRWCTLSRSACPRGGREVCT